MRKREQLITKRAWYEAEMIDFQLALRAHLLRVVPEPRDLRWVDRLCEAATAVEQTPEGLKISLPTMEDGEPIDDETVTMICAEPFTGETNVEPTIVLLARAHNGFEVKKGDDLTASFSGLDESGELVESPTLDQPGIAVDCFPDGWAVIGSREARWMGEETRVLGVRLWPECSLGAVVFQTVAAVALGFHPSHAQTSPRD